MAELSIIVDDRESGSQACEELSKLGVKLKFERLAFADFVLSERVCVERKSASDFESSVVDGRLFSQARELKENFSSPLVAIVGNEFFRLHENAIRGALLSLTVEYHVPFFRFEDDRDFALFLAALAERELRGPRDLKLQFSKKGTSVKQQQRLLVESLPDVGPKTALALLEHFKTIGKMALASEKDLMEVKGVGKERAKAIRSVFSSVFE